MLKSRVGWMHYNLKGLPASHYLGFISLSVCSKVLTLPEEDLSSWAKSFSIIILKSGLGISVFFFKEEEGEGSPHLCFLLCINSSLYAVLGRMFPTTLC